jgi:predicted MFS family arabinose efflux permease
VGYRKEQSTLRGSAFAMVFYSISMALFAVSESLVLALVVQFAVGFFYFSMMTGLQTLIQQIVDESKRGRIMALFQICWAGLVPFGGLGMGTVASSVGLVPTLLVCALVCIAYAIVLVVLANRLGPHARELPASA